MLVVVCAPDLLHCSAVTPLQRAWNSVASCRLEKPRILNEVRAQVGDEKAVMSTCRLFLDEGRRFQRPLLAKDPEPSELSLF